jgi:methylated-DNA-[protein]-cysteine S-methyltransferase
MTENLAFALFDSTIGFCAVIWSERGIVGVQLPEKDTPATRARVLKRFPAALESEPPASVQRAIAKMAALLDGEPAEFGDVALDTGDLPEFNRKVYAIASSIQRGSTLTYGEVAERLGDKLLAREVGQALGQNPTPLIVPCHRVLAAGGKTGGFSAPGGVVTKLRILTIEGAQPGGPTLFDRLPLVVPPR